MIVEYAYDNLKICYQCKWLELKEDEQWYGYCACPHNKIKNRYRSVTDKKCTWKNADVAKSK